MSIRAWGGHLKQFARNPFNVGALAPSGPSLVNELLRNVDFTSDDLALVEVGPGVGPVTQDIFLYLKPGQKFFAMELDQEFYDILTSKWESSFFIHDSCENILKYCSQGALDNIICSLPWTNFSSELQIQLLEKMQLALKEGGHFSTFSYVTTSWVPSAIRFKNLLDVSFEEVKVSPVVWNNLPPALVYHCRHRAQ